MPLSRASTRRRYNSILGITFLLTEYGPGWSDTESQYASSWSVAPGWEKSWWHFRCHTKEALCHKWHRIPLKFASSIEVVHKNYRHPHTTLPWTRETRNFASWKTNSPKINQEIGTLRRWTSYPLCLPPNRNLYILQAWSLLLLGTISQSLGYEPNIERFIWPQHSDFP